MKPLTFASCALALFFLGNPPARAQEPLRNGSFEDGLNGWKLQASNPAVAQVLPEAASLGRAGLRVRGLADCPRFELRSGAVPVTPGKTYCVGFWAGGGGGETAPGVYVDMVFTDAAQKELKPAPAAIRKWPAAGVEGGMFFGRTVLAAAAPEGAVELSVRIKANGATAGPVDIDDFRVEVYDENSPEEQALKAHAAPPSDTPYTKELLAEIARDPYRGKTPPKIVLKLDDFKPARGGVHPRWQKIADFARERKIKVGFGIIAKTMEEECQPFAQWAKEANAQGRIEFWCHGYDHMMEGKITEFSGQPYDYQKAHFALCQKLAQEKLGFPFVSFGAPGNASDATTPKVLAEDLSMKVWMYGDAKNPGGKTVLRRAAVTIETPTMIPNYAAFLDAYAHNRGARYFVMQGHPSGWGDDRFEQTRMIVDFLLAQKAEFVFPRELAE